MDKTATRQEESPRMRKLTVQLTESLVRRIKMQAAEELTTVASIVARTLEKGVKN